MILVDSPVWIDHLRSPIPALADVLANGSVMVHPFVLGEVALGSLRDRHSVLDGLRALPAAPVAFDPEVLMFIERHRLPASRIGYVDAHLLASARLVDAGLLWTRDRRLHEAALRIGIAWPRPARG